MADALFNTGQDIIDDYKRLENILKLQLKNFRKRKERSTGKLATLIVLLERISKDVKHITKMIMDKKDNIPDELKVLEKRRDAARKRFSEINFRPMPQLTGDVNNYLSKVDSFIEIINKFLGHRRPVIVGGESVVWDREHKKPVIVSQ